MKNLFKLTSLFIITTSLTFAMSVSELNKATKEDLTKINGIGVKKAEAIISYRKTASFKTVEDVTSVKGIGNALAKNIKNDVFKKSNTKKTTKKSTPKPIDSKKK